MNQSSQKIVQRHQPCPNCPSSDAYCEWEDGHGYCFSCQFHKPKEKEFLEEIYTYEYIPHRGLNKRTLEKYDIKTKIDKDGRPIADGFFYPNACTKVRLLDKKDFTWIKPEGVNQVSPDVFGRDRFDAGCHESIIITEGEYDAATLFQVLDVPVVSVRSATSAASDCIAVRQWLDSFKKVLLAFDGDAAGRRGCADVAKLFDYNKVYVVRFDRHKDANAYLLAGEADELRNIYANARRFIPECVIAVNDEAIETILAERPSVGVPYPWAGLNEKLHGIRTRESVLVTAPPGVGKTEFMQAIEYQLLQETDYNVASIFIELPKADHLRSLASTHLQRPAFLPEHGVPEAAVVAAVKDARKHNDRLYMYSHFGSDDPDVIVDTIRFLVTCCSVRFVLLDHISMVVSGLRNERDERRVFDYLCTKLEVMLKDLDFGLIFVSHINDNGQTRGSRSMEQLCDIRIELSRDIKGESDIVNMLISKNRPPMTQSGPAGSYKFDKFKRRYFQVESPSIVPDGGSDGRYQDHFKPQFV